MNQHIKILNFTDLSYDLKKMILSWRNDPQIKQWMYNSQNITMKEHLNFIKSLQNNPSKQYFLVKKDDTYIGVIDFTDISKESVIIGVYKNPHIKGVGKLLMEIIITYSFKTLNVKTIYSEVFEDNLHACRLYKSYGFKPFNSKIINHKKVICMELKNENR